MNTNDIEFTASNLEKLADYIEQNVSQDQLNMELARSDKDNNPVEFISIDDCGTYGCALGWSPFHPDMGAEDWMYVANKLSFRSYAKRYYPWLTYSCKLYRKAFGATQSSDKPSVIRRLREVANELRERAA